LVLFAKRKSHTGFPYRLFRQWMNVGCAGKTLRDPSRMHAILGCLISVFTTRHFANQRLPLPYLSNEPTMGYEYEYSIV